MTRVQGRTIGQHTEVDAFLASTMPHLELAESQAHLPGTSYS